MDPLNDVALLKIAVLQQDLHERDVEEARKRKRTTRPEDTMAGGGKEEAVWILRQIDGGAQGRRPTVLQLPRWSLPGCHA